MGKYFSDVVDQALEDIYYCYDKERAARAAEALFQAAKTGDADAAYILSRCFSGPQYSWDYHPFTAQDDTAEALIRQSIVQGSAMGVLGAMRCGMLTPELEKAMPFSSLQQAWDVVYEKAQAGCLFCMNMIGNTYYWLDIPRIQNKGSQDFPSKEAFGDYLRRSTLECIPWFERAFRGGMGFAGRNLYNLYDKGEEGWLVPQKDKALEVARLGAELGYPDWQERYGGKLVNKPGCEREAFELFEKAAAQGQLYSYVYLGWLYQDGKGVPKDVPKALECYEAAAADTTDANGACRAAKLYFFGQDGVPQDYARAVQLFEKAHSMNNFTCNDLLGTCCLFGYGCRKDPVRARRLFQEAKQSSDRLNYGLGLIYADGLGVPEDIGRGVAYLQKASNYAPAKEALLRFKKTLFGKWVRR